MRRAIPRVLLILWISIYGLPLLAGPQNIENEIVELKVWIGDRISQVTEFRELASQSQQVGYRVFIMGGLAASFAHYAYLERTKVVQKDPELAETYFSYGWDHIFAPSQDIDIAFTRVDGTPESSDDFRRMHALAKNLFPSKKVDLFGLFHSETNRPNLINNRHWRNQNTDSLSTTMIEIEGEKEIQDFVQGDLVLLRSLANHSIEFYRRPQHKQTNRYRDGLNPEVLSAIRLLVNASRYQLEISNSSAKEVNLIIEESKFEVLSPYALQWIERNAKKIYTQSFDLEFTDQLMKKFENLKLLILSRFSSSKNHESMSWYLSRKILNSDSGDIRKLNHHAVKTGKTAKDLHLHLLSHSTPSLGRYWQITRNLYRRPNFILSINGDHQNAVHGDGVYFMDGDTGNDTSYNQVRCILSPEAREGEDFKVIPHENGLNKIVLVFNRSKLKTLGDSNPNMTKFPQIFSMAIGNQQFSEDLKKNAFQIQQTSLSSKERRFFYRSFFSISKQFGLHYGLLYLSQFNDPLLKGRAYQIAQLLKKKAAPMGIMTRFLTNHFISKILSGPSIHKILEANKRFLVISILISIFMPKSSWDYLGAKTINAQMLTLISLISWNVGTSLSLTFGTLLRSHVLQNRGLLVLAEQKKKQLLDQANPMAKSLSNYCIRRLRSFRS